MRLEEHAPEHKGTENTVFRGKQESDETATWTLGQAVSAGRGGKQGKADGGRSGWGTMESS